jgi:WD40 repeat protein
MSSRDDDDGSPTETRTATRTPESSAASVPPRNPAVLVTVPVDHYEVGEERARGGLGKIVEAEDLRLGRTVAIKELLHVDEKSARRFIREARLTARLQHPSIVPVHEAGRWPTGEPFYTMKMVSGRSLKEAMAEKRTLRERLSLLPNILAVAEAIAYAHSQRVIHRDLKPSNILVGEFGETVVVDWGLAKDLAEPVDSDLGTPVGPYRTLPAGDLTAVGAVMGTPAYMPPEQARGENVDERADVYALGAILYHLLCGTSPFSGSSAEVISQVKEASPRPVLEVVPDAPADLAAIVTRAMEREPSNRYAHAGLLAEDLARFQTGQLVRVHGYSIAELVKRWVRRNRSLTVATAAFVVLGLGAVAFFLSRERGLRIVAENALTRSDSERTRAESEHVLAESRSLSLMEDRGRDELDQGHPFRAAPYFAKLLEAAPDSLAYRSLATESLRAMGAVKWAVDYRVGTIGTRSSISLSRDGTKILATGSTAVVLLDSEDGRLLHRFDGPMLCGALSDDGLLVVTSASNGIVQVWSATDGSPLRIIPARDNAGACLFGPGSHIVLLPSRRGPLVAWNGDTGETIRTFVGGPFPVADWSRDGRTIIAVTDEDLVAYDAVSGWRLWGLRSTSDEIMDARFSADGDSVLVSTETRLRLYEARTGSLVRTIEDTLDTVVAGSTSKDGNSILGVYANGLAAIWGRDTKAPALVGVHGSRYLRAAFYGLGDAYVVGVSQENELRITDKDGHRIFALDLQGAVVGRFAVRPVDGSVYVGSSDGLVYRIESPMHGAVREATRLPGTIYRLAYSHDGTTIGAVDEGGWVSLVSDATGPVSWSTGEGLGLWRVALAPDDSTIITSGMFSFARLWDRQSHKLIRELTGHHDWIYSVAYSPDSNVIATSARDGDVRFWNGHTGEDLGSPLTGQGFAVAFSPDGARLATASFGGAIRIWDFVSRKQLLTIEAHPGFQIDTLRFDRSGRYLVSAGWDDHLAKVWDPRTGRLVSTLVGNRSRLMGAEISPDASTVVTVGFDFKACLFDLRTGDLLRVIDGPVHAVSFSPDGTELATGVGEALLVWDIRLDQRPALNWRGPSPTAPRGSSWPVASCRSATSWRRQREQSRASPSSCSTLSRRPPLPPADRGFRSVIPTTKHVAPR